MVVPLLVLVGGTLLAWVGAVLWVDPSASAPTLALAITLPPAVISFLLVVKISKRWPEAGPTSVLAATFLRMMAAVGCVAILSERTKEFETTPTALAQWTTGFYLLTLIIETVLLYIIVKRLSEGVRHEPPNR